MEEVEIPEEVLKLAEERKVARDNKDWEKADRLRDQIKEKGFEVKDIGDEFELTRLL